MDDSNYYQKGQYESIESGTKIVHRKNYDWSLHTKFMKVAVVVFSLLAVTVLWTNKTRNTQKGISFDEIFGGEEASKSFSIDVLADSPGYGQLTSLSTLPWEVVVEPFKSQTLYIDNFSLDGDTITLNNEDFDVNWSINKVSYSGTKISVNLKETGVLSCTVTISPSTSSIAKTGRSSFSLNHPFTLAVKYVRRELRSLSDDDRNEFFRALGLIYTVDAKTGLEKYGSKFHTAEFFLARHLNGAATTDCDHWHDGAGIVTHHVAYTFEVEQALQAINPTLSMPYWEYGMDPTIYDNFEDSPIFNKDWFGESNPKSADHGIADGSLWESISMPSGEPYKKWSVKDSGTLNPFVNGWGVMRSPWNNNKAKGIARHNQTYSMTQYKSMPSCRDLRSCFQSATMSDLNDCINGYTHGPVHIMIGGAWNEGDVFDSGTVGFVRNPDKLLFFKVLWRLGFTRCPTSCAEGATCKCAVPQEYIDKYGAKEILTIANIVYALEHSLPSTADDTLYLRILRAVEDPGQVGEMFTSAASFDPTFWPLHGAAERLVGYKRLMVSSGKVESFDDSWGYPVYNKASGAAYLNGYCDWSKVASADDLTLPECSFDSICYGHNENDLLEFGNFLNKGESYTNAEFYKFIDPTNDDLPYTYDNYAFSFCDGLGFDFLDTTSSDAGSSVTPSGGISSGGGGKSSSTGSATAAAAAAAAAAQAAQAAAAAANGQSVSSGKFSSSNGKFTSTSPRRFERK